MKNPQFTKLSPDRIKVIERLLDKGDTISQIRKITGHGRNTIRKYRFEYINRRVIEAMDKMMKPKVSIIRINLFIVYLFVVSVGFLMFYGLYSLINY